MCDRAEREFKEQFFGFQVYDSGAARFYDETGGYPGEVAIHTPTNPFPFTPVLGFMGLRYAQDYSPIQPEYTRPGYKGIMPLAEQPKLTVPYPYREPVLF